MNVSEPANGAPRVSVVIPAFNAAWSIERTLASVLGQSVADFELIVVDDGSTDTTGEVVHQAGKGDPRVRVVRQENRGLAGARNRGIEEARAPLVAPLDADDVWEPDYLAATIGALDQHLEAPFAFTYHYRMDEHDRRLPTPIYQTPPRHDFLGLLSVNSVGCGSAAVFRRAEVLAAGGYDETLARRAGQGAEDLKLILALAAKGQPRLVERALVGYRHVASGMSLGNPEAQLASMLAVFDDLRRDHPDLPARALADARSMAIVWLLPALLRRRRWRRAVVLACRAYLLNPLWFLNSELRATHVGWLRSVLSPSARAR
jgi:glycosyltransferase involved in cell wall biosynthesis